MSHKPGDELPIGYKSGENEGGENYKTRTASLRIKVELPRIQSETIIIILYLMDILGGWSQDLEDELNELVESKIKGVLHNNYAEGSNLENIKHLSDI